MAFKVEVDCYKCGETFEVKDDCFPMQEEVGYTRQAVCTVCSTDCGEISVMLTIR